jgi:hypothetical protein
VLSLQLNILDLTRSFNQRRSSHRSDRSVSFSLPSGHKHSSSSLHNTFANDVAKNDDKRVSDTSLQAHGRYPSHSPTLSLSSFCFPPQPEEDVVLPNTTSPIPRPATPFELGAEPVEAATEQWRTRRRSNSYAHARCDSSSMAYTTSIDARASTGGPGSLLPPVVIDGSSQSTRKSQVAARRSSTSSTATLSAVPSSACQGWQPSVRRLHYQPAVIYPQQVVFDHQNYATHTHQPFGYATYPAGPFYSNAPNVFPSLEHIPMYDMAQGSFVGNILQLTDGEPRPLVAPPPTPVLPNVGAHAP